MSSEANQHHIPKELSEQDTSEWSTNGTRMHVRQLPSQIALDNENNWLYRHASNITSQAGENGMISKVFEVIGVNNQWCVELGAGDGRYLSNVWPLVTGAGWNAILIESEQHWFDKLTAEHVERPQARCIWRSIEIEGENTLDAILSEQGAPADIDLISIDIDGADYHLWSTLIRYRPRLVVIEFNPTIPSNVDFVQPPDVTIQQGSSLAAMVRLGKEKGYELVGSTWVNAFFVPSELFHQFNIKDNSLSGMGFNLIGDQLFYLFDGTIVKTGSMVLPWQGLRIAPEDLQILPRYDRCYRKDQPRRTILPAFIKGEK